MEVFSPVNSKIKMVILTKHSFDNEVWWSPIKQNRWRNERIIEGMLRRFKKHPMAGFTNVVQFFENGVRIYQEKL